MQDNHLVRGYKNDKMTVVWLRAPCRFEGVCRGVNGDRFAEKTVSGRFCETPKPLKLNGSFLFVTVYGGAQRNVFPVTPPKTPVSFRFERKPQ